jgi:uncharacterized protein YicC (UPF0701 family)
MSVKLVDQIKFIGWDIEAVVERLNEIKEMRGKDGRGISETSLSGVRELQDLVLKLDAAIKRPTITTQQHEVVERFRSLQQRLIDDNGF